MEHFSNSVVRQLTPSERRIAQLLSDEGLSNAEIGTRLGLTERTVRNCLSSTFGKLGIGSRIQLAKLWNTEIFQIGLSA